MSDSFVSPWTVARQVTLSMGFCRQEYWSELPFPPPGDLPDPGLEPESPALASRFFTTEPPGKPVTYKGTVSSLKKESTHAVMWMAKDSVWFHLLEVPRVVRFIETESRMGVTRGTKHLFYF